MYDYYASLGFNCEGAFQVRRVLGRDESNFFSWNITTFAAAKMLIQQRFDGIMQVENLRHHGDGSLVHDVSYGYMFHSDFPVSHNTDFRRHMDTLASHQAKARYLVRKFFDVAATCNSIAYFYKTQEEDVRAQACELAQVLADAANQRYNFTLVVLQEADRFEQDWGVPHVSNRYLRRLAPIDDATDGHVASWDRVFGEFPHQDGLRLANY